MQKLALQVWKNEESNILQTDIIIIFISFPPLFFLFVCLNLNKCIFSSCIIFPNDHVIRMTHRIAKSQQCRKAVAGNAYNKINVHSSNSIWEHIPIPF